MTRKKLVGIYKITNKANGKIYIGQSRDLKQRLNTHKNTLINNTHYNEYLQRSWNKYGQDNFIFEIIEYCEIDNLYERENHWIVFYNSHESKYGYNATLPPKDGKCYSHTDEARLKLSKNRRMFDDEELLSYLHEYFYHFGKIPTARELDDNKSFPNSNTYNDRFGSYKEALIEADLYSFVKEKWTFDRREYSKEEVLEKFKVFIDKNNRFPNNEEMKNCVENDLPSFNVIRKHFSGLEEVKTIFGFDNESNVKRENELALKELKSLYIKDGVVTSRTIDSSNITTHSAKFYSERFGSLMKAYELIGIYTKEHVTQELKNFANTYNKLPSNKDIDIYKLPPRRIISLYYTTQELKDILGFNDNEIKEKENKEALQSLKQLYDIQGYVDQDTINASELTKSVKFYCSRFGSLKSACLEANIPLDKLILKYPKLAN